MQQNINISTPDDGLGDVLRNSFDKTNQNFTELYNGKVDKITGKGLSENDFTDADKTKLDGIEAGAQVNVNADFGENDSSAPGYILNRPPSMYASVGYFDYNDVSTILAPLVLVSGVAKKLTNDTLGPYTDLGGAPYGVSNIWKQYANQFDFSELAIGDTLDMRVDALLTTTGTNKTYKILLKLGIGTPSEFTTLVGSGELKAAVTDEPIVKDISFYIGSDDVRDAPAELYILVDGLGSVKVNGWYVRILRKGLNIIDINSDPLKLDKVSTVDVEKVYVKNADGTQSMKPTSEFQPVGDYITVNTTQTVTGNKTFNDVGLIKKLPTDVYPNQSGGNFTIGGSGGHDIFEFYSLDGFDQDGLGKSQIYSNAEYGNFISHFSLDNQVGSILKINQFETFLRNVFTDNFTGNSTTLYVDGQNGKIKIEGTQNRIANLGTSLITGTKNFEFPNNSGTLALLSDLSEFTTPSEVATQITTAINSNKTSFTHNILASDWTLVSGKYEAIISNAGILANSFVDVIPSNDHVDIVRNAQIYPSVLISAGNVKVYSKFLPSDTITVTININ